MYGFRMIVPFPLCELQGAYVGLVLNGAASLPTAADMIREEEQFIADLKRNNVPHHHTHVLNHVQYCRDIASRVNVALTRIRSGDGRDNGADTPNSTTTTPANPPYEFEVMDDRRIRRRMLS